ncbi:MAG: HK97 gp10 family phage protein [Erysipelotrichaceae bacterium]|nr:HK97 gp10 family phage protein [Erysipelotrichaceae bacterium]
MFWYTTSKLQAELYGERINDMLNMLSSEVANEIGEQIIADATLTVQSSARQLAPKDTSALLRSIKIEKNIEGSEHVGTVYTNSEYASYMEFGTGPNGQASHSGISPKVSPTYRQNGWGIPAEAMSAKKAEEYGLGIFKRNGEVTGYYTKGHPATPFMYPALKDNYKRIINHSKKVVRDKLKELSDD